MIFLFQKLSTISNFNHALIYVSVWHKYTTQTFCKKSYANNMI